MSSTLKVVCTLGLALGGVAFLALQSAGDVQYYATVDKVVPQPEAWLARSTIQVHGYARKVPLRGTIVDQTVRRTFEIESHGHALTVVHEGVVPDTFKEEAETVVRGSLSRQPDGTLLLTTVGGEQGIMAKCPSKYEGKRME
jgi:cytochrome c-type biogenesis protein CcmE